MVNKLAYPEQSFADRFDFCGGASPVLATNAPSYYLWCRRVRVIVIRTRKQSERSLCLASGILPPTSPNYGQLTHSITWNA